jgi:hypothetical protein
VLERIGGGIVDGVTYPGQVYREGLPDTEAAVNWAAPTALSMIGLSRLPGGAPIVKGANDPYLSPKRSVHPELEPWPERQLTYPPIRQRPAEWDYPEFDPNVRRWSVPTHDIDGRRRLHALHIAGRRLIGGVDMPLTAAQMEDVVFRLTGNPVRRADPADLPTLANGTEAAGAYFNDFNPRMKKMKDGYTRHIAISNKLTPQEYYVTLGHEVGHLISDLVGRNVPATLWKNNIPTRGLKDELVPLYNLGYNGYNYPAPSNKMVTPEVLGYRPEKVPMELMAEAGGAYLTDPNLIKSIAPETARRLRRWWNAHPEYSKVLQLNALGGGMAVGGVLGSGPGQRIQE